MNQVDDREATLTRARADRKKYRRQHPRGSAMRVLRAAAIAEALEESEFLVSSLLVTVKQDAVEIDFLRAALEGIADLGEDEVGEVWAANALAEFDGRHSPFCRTLRDTRSDVGTDCNCWMAVPPTDFYGTPIEPGGNRMIPGLE
jgi:hypothetical protein